MSELANSVGVRRSDPDTSQQAAESFAAAGKDYLLKAAVLQVMKRIDTTMGIGMTVPEIAHYLNVPRDSVSPRMRSLEHDGEIFDSGTRRVPTTPAPNEQRQRECIIWALRPADMLPMSRGKMPTRVERAMQALARIDAAYHEGDLSRIRFILLEVRDLIGIGKREA